MENDFTNIKKSILSLFYQLRFIEHSSMQKYLIHGNECGGNIIIERTDDWIEAFPVCEKCGGGWMIDSPTLTKRIINYLKFKKVREVIVKPSIEDTEELIQRLNELGIDQDKQAEEFEQYVRKSRGLE